MLLILVPVFGFLMLRPSARAPQAVAIPSPAPTSLPTPAPAPASPSVLGRTELIEAAARAASAFAAGQPAPPENIRLAGQRFALRLPFGCGGPVSDENELGPAGWFYDAETQTLRAQVTPEVWSETPWAVAGSGGRPFESAEGFWIARPWSPSDDCPARRSDGAPGQQASPQTLGIARFFEPGAPRAERRNGAAYQLSKNVTPANAPGPSGLRLLIEGRLSVDPSRQPVGCWSATSENRPVCVFNARFDRIAITNPSGETVFAEWKN
jgi:hypothetical protein